MTPMLPGQAITVGWLLLPFLAAFLAALLPRLARPLALFCCVAAAAGATALHFGMLPASLLLVGPQGVALRPDSVAAPFLLLNALVCGAVVLDSWKRPLPASFPVLLMVLHGGLASAFVAVDLISLYVALEVVGISAFLLILCPRPDASLWVALRYLLISNTAMSLFLIGAAVVYLQQGSFQLEAVAATRGGGALALLLVGLLTKAGVFLTGLWLPRTHAEAPAEVSALLSGVVVTAGVVPLLRLSSAVPAAAAVIVPIGLASAVLGIVFALAEGDAKRLLAWSTLSQMGLVALSPLAGGAFALAHGVAKASLFLIARRFPARDLAGWTSRALPAGVWGPLWIGSLSIVGVPPFLGFLAKVQLDEAGKGPLALGATLLGVGTAAVYIRLWGAPLRSGEGPPQNSPGDPEWSWGVLLLVAALLVLGSGSWASLPHLGGALLKTVVVVAAGLGLHALLEPLRRMDRLRLPDPERFTDLIGGLGLVGAGLLVALQR